MDLELEFNPNKIFTYEKQYYNDKLWILINILWMLPYELEMKMLRWSSIK